MKLETVEIIIELTLFLKELLIKKCVTHKLGLN